MPLPDRPVDAAEIATEWGQEIHDRVLAASGCDVWSSTSRVTGTSLIKMNLDMVTEDPGGYLDAANDRVEVPTGKEGLYLINMRLKSINGGSGTSNATRALIYVNGTEVGRTLEDNQDGVAVSLLLTILSYLSAGDQIEIWAQRRGSGSSPDVNVSSLQLLRVTDNYGA